MFLFGYFLLISGVFYNLKHDTASMGQYTNPKTGKSSPIIFKQNNFKDQYVLEGIVSSFLICLGCVGFISLDYWEFSGKFLFLKNFFVQFKIQNSMETKTTRQ